MTHPDPRVEAAARSIWYDNQETGREIPFESASVMNRVFARSQAVNALKAADAALKREGGE